MINRFKKNIVFVFLFLLLIPIYSFAYEKRDKIDVSILPVIQFDTVAMKFVYKYTLQSSERSQQEVNRLLINTSGAHSNAASPLGWRFKDTSRVRQIFRPFAAWHAGWGNHPNGKLVPSHGNVEGTPYQVKPGQTLSGYSVESMNPPGVVDFFAYGFRKLRTVEEAEANPYPVGHSSLDDAFRGKTIGPVIVTDTSSGGLIDRLIVLKDSMPGFGWITNQGIINSLNAKLSAAKGSIARGNHKTASDQLNAFINELNAQKGKQVNATAWALLRANAEFLIHKLGE